MAKVLLERQAGSNPIRFPLVAIHPEQNILNSIKLLATLSIVIISVAFVSGVVPADAPEPHRTDHQHTTHSTDTIPARFVLTWNAVAEATHYRIGCVNMDRDYPRAKATVTGNWREAMVYVDVEAQNLGAERPHLHAARPAGRGISCVFCAHEQRTLRPAHLALQPGLAVSDRHGPRGFLPCVRAISGSRYVGATFYCGGVPTGAASTRARYVHAI